ncbi:MAG: hypothetical protein ACJ74J_18880 [Blastocatellia bacterium]
MRNRFTDADRSFVHTLRGNDRITVAMKSPAKSDWLRLAALALLTLCSVSCQRRAAETTAAMIAAGEPEVYAATITRLAVDGEAREQSTSQIARRGDWRREQWSEAGGARALIQRPDLGKIYLLDLDHHIYIESDFAAPLSALPTDAARAASRADAAPAPTPLQPEEIDRAFDTAPAPVQVESRALADQTIQDYACQVIESRATFADGRVEITRSHRARSLAGLPLLIEVESPNGARLTIERHDIRLDVGADEFTVPAGFKRVARLPDASM